LETIEKTGKTAERLAKTNGDTYKVVVDHFAAQQERSVRFAQEVLDGAVREVRHQAESNRSLTQELVERAEQQRGAYQTLVGQSVDAYMDLLYAPLSYYKQGLRVVEGEIDRAASFPIANYDEQNVAEISKHIDRLSAAQIREIREYEKRNKNRETLIDQFDRKLKAASA
jgi:molybdopterin converting factor small subunit